MPHTRQIPDRERLRAFERNLAELTLSYTPAFQEAVASSLSDTGRILYLPAMELYSQDTGRWYDPWGIPDSVNDYKSILDSERLSDREKLMALTILFYHDSGYVKQEDSAMYGSEKLRESHMRASANNASRNLHALQINGENVFTRAELSRIFNAIIKHDGHYLGEDPMEEDMLLRMFIDGDRIFVPSFLSAYKDYVAKHAEKMTGEEFLRMRQSDFFLPGEDIEYGQRIRITNRSDNLYSKKYTPSFFDATKRVLAVHMLSRTAELDMGLFDHARFGDWAGFEPHARDYIEGSLEAARDGTSLDMQRFGDDVKVRIQRGMFGMDKPISERRLRRPRVRNAPPAAPDQLNILSSVGV